MQVLAADGLVKTVGVGRAARRVLDGVSLSVDADEMVLQTWMLDHSLPGRLGQIARELSYLDAQGGRPNNFAGTRLDRNVVLYWAGAG